MVYTRRNSDQPEAALLGNKAAGAPGVSLSQFYIRYLNLTIIVAHLLLAGEVAPGLFSYELILGLAGLYFVGNTVLMLAAVYQSRWLPPQSLFMLDCAVIMLGIAQDPYASLPVQLLLLESVIDMGMRSGFAAYRRGLLIAALALVAGFGLREYTGPGLELPGVTLAVIMIALAYYMYELLKRSDDNLRQLIKLSHYDELTGLLNRRALYEQARELCATLGAGERAVLMFADLDNLKTYNDQHGHAFGDSVIQVAGRAIGGCVGEHDIAARYGGDEFIAFFPDIDIVQARRIAERLQKTAAQTSLEVADAKVSLSIGLAELAGPNANFDIAMQRADAALYRAKARQDKGAIAIAMQAG